MNVYVKIAKGHLTPERIQAYSFETAENSIIECHLTIVESHVKPFEFYYLFSVLSQLKFLILFIY